MTVLYPQQEAQIIAAQLQGQVLRLPNLQNLFAGWPLEIHPRLQELVTFSEGITLNILESKDRIAMHKRGNLACYVAMWFPHAEFDRLKTVCLLNDWMHAWDDSVDNDRYDLARDFGKASRFRHDTLVPWNSVLGFTDQDVTQLPVDGVYRINNILPDLGRRLCASYNKAQLRRLLDTITWFIESCAIEHELRLSMRIPLYDEYIKLREGAGGAPPMIEMIELANHTALPEWMFSTPEMQIMKETLVHAIVLVNDIYAEEGIGHRVFDH